METALDLNRQTFAASERPFVYFNRVDYAFFARKGAEGKDLKAMAVWGNSGNTPTTQLKQTVGCLPNQSPLDEPFDHMHFDSAKGLPMVYGPKTAINLGGVCNLSYETIQQINDHSTHFYMCGLVTYSDRIEHRAQHKTEFCYELTGIGWTDAANNTGVAVGRHNCADADCP